MKMLTLLANHPLFRSSQNRQLATTLAIWLTLGLFAAGALWHSSNSARESAVARDLATAQAVADWVARQSLEHLVNQDPVSLQLLLQQAAEVPGIRAITVHDVEQNTLGQQGEPDKLRHAVASASIVLHDSFAGTVSVNTEPGSGSHFAWASLVLTLIVTLPFAAICALLLGSWQAPTNHRAPQRPAPAHEEAQQTEPEPQLPAPPEAGLYLRVCNWAQLRHQLNRQALERLTEQLQQRLDSLASIYAAEPVNSGGAIGLGFRGADAPFRAACCGLLLREWQQRQPNNLLQLSLAVMPCEASGANPDSDLLLARPGRVSLHPELQDHLALSERLALHDAEYGPEISGLAGSYQKLLDNQLARLVEAAPANT
ncbi:hypothetical protein [Biformimicrobium ophioploci]|uniref:Uncharacterized protein n=1 Tax=Biformimicrobium ophioploci TaxID=3036711 RepID=A0ABQ6LUQ7_9GAMM|nr:hypothetical protein [Microbulbifer sp. NKW57]GMG85801.1 hypothetical protein MNKW57_01220 [Microbulbifer sp. NKW57]